LFSGIASNDDQNSSSSSNAPKTVQAAKKEKPIKFNADVECLIIDMIKEQLNKRVIVENKNLIKLLQATSGFAEIRNFALSKMDAWLSNPKVRKQNYPPPSSCSYVTCVFPS
jgi:hypothetical protein